MPVSCLFLSVAACFLHFPFVFHLLRIEHIISIISFLFIIWIMINTSSTYNISFMYSLHYLYNNPRVTCSSALLGHPSSSHIFVSCFICFHHFSWFSHILWVPSGPVKSLYVGARICSAPANASQSQSTPVAERCGVWANYEGIVALRARLTHGSLPSYSTSSENLGSGDAKFEQIRHEKTVITWWGLSWQWWSVVVPNQDMLWQGSASKLELSCCKHRHLLLCHFMFAKEIHALQDCKGSIFGELCFHCMPWD